MQATSVESRWERRLGVIVPSWNTVMEHEWQRMTGGFASVHAQRIRHTADTEADLIWLSTQAPQAAALLAHAKPDAICHGCTASGFLKTPEDDRALAAALEQETGTPVVTSSAAIVDALRALGAHRVSVASPYEDWLNGRLAGYLQAAGFEVLAIRGLATQSHGSVTPERVHALALEVVRPQSQALFISCSNLRTLQSIEALEAQTGLPVVTSNQAALWGTLRRIGDRRGIAGAGRLFSQA